MRVTQAKGASMQRQSQKQLSCAWGNKGSTYAVLGIKFKGAVFVVAAVVVATLYSTVS